MTNISKVEGYQNFFIDQVKEAEAEQKNLMMSPVNQLLRREEIVFGYVDHINENRGHVVLRFPKDRAPRLKVQKSIMAIKKAARADLGQNVYDWNCSFFDFCKNGEYHSETSDLMSLYYLRKNDPRYDYVGCSALSVSMFDRFKRTLQAGKSLQVVVFNPFPPVDYMNNLVNFLEIYKDMPEQLLEPKISYEDWHPEELEYNPKKENGIAERVMKTLEKDDCCILQGPPGTGKSYTIAYIIAHYLDGKKTVCATTMANKGLMELVKQPPLQPFLKDGRISKSNLSADERKEAVGIQPAKKGFVVAAGDLFCSTNYVLSHVYNAKNISDNGLPSYDLVIMEEASQAFLATILAFKKLGNKCLIVGDPMQLPPIITNPSKSIYKAWNVNTQVEGLKTYALGTNVKSYRIITTFRLSPASAKLTSTFYSNHFYSVQKERLDLRLCRNDLFPSEGGDLYCYTQDFTNGIISETALKLIGNVIVEMTTKYPRYTLAIISPFRDTVKKLQRSFLTETATDKLTIETIDRIQGMTVDYAILYIPGRNPGFALDDRRFNVATSRSRSTTLIISDIPLTELQSISSKVSNFVKKCKHAGENNLKRDEDKLWRNK